MVKKVSGWGNSLQLGSIWFLYYGLLGYTCLQKKKLNIIKILQLGFISWPHCTSNWAIFKNLSKSNYCIVSVQWRQIWVTNLFTGGTSKFPHANVTSGQDFYGSNNQWLIWEYVLQFMCVSSEFLSTKGWWVVFEDSVFWKLTCQSGGKRLLWTEGTFSSSRFSNLADEPESGFLGYQDKLVTLFAPLPSILVQLYGQ